MSLGRLHVIATVWTAALAASWATPAWAQDPASAEDVRETRSWLRTAPLRMGEAADVVVDPTDPLVVFAVGMDGAAWLSTDGGRGWERVLDRDTGTLSNDEDRLQLLDAYLQDAVDVMSDLDIDESLDIEDYDEDAYQDQFDQVQQEMAQLVADEARADLATQSFLFGDDTTQGVVHPRASMTRGHSELWVGRSDGLWMSSDMGATWTQVLDIASTQVVYLPGPQRFVAGTADGFHYGQAPTLLDAAADGTEGVLILDLSVAPEGIYAGTSDGLWFSQEGRGWFPTGPTSEPIVAVQADPNADEALWVTLSDGLWRSDDRGRTFDQVPAGDLEGVLDLGLLADGRLLAASEDGVWFQTPQGGFSQLTRGFNAPRATAIDGNTLDALFVANPGGVFRLVPRSEERAPLPQGEAPRWVEPDALLSAALSRPGVRMESLRGNARAANSALPQIRVDARFMPDRDLSYSVSSGTNRGVDSDFQATVALTWTPAGRKSSSSLAGVVIDGDLVVVGSDEQTVLAAKVGRRSAAYQRTLTERVLDLFSDRIDLELESRQVVGSPLADRVEHALRVLEVEAQLDTLTDGYVSRYNFAQGETP